MKQYVISGMVVIAIVAAFCIGCPEHGIPPHTVDSVWEVQNDEYERQLRRGDGQLDRVDTINDRIEAQTDWADAQANKMDRLLDRWEKQADRFDKILDRWESQQP